MIAIAGTLPVNADRIDDAKAGFSWMQAETRKEDGCVTYTFTQDLDDPALFHVFEYWESAAALAAHGKSAHMVEFGPKMKGVFAGRPSVLQYKVSETGPIGS